jgi:hypothetical protein
MEANAVQMLKCLLCAQPHEAETPHEPRAICPRCADPGDPGETLQLVEEPPRRSHPGLRVGGWPLGAPALDARLR